MKFSFNTRHALRRRSFLRGVGATMALPLLECMQVPSLAAAAGSAAGPAAPVGVHRGASVFTGVGRHPRPLPARWSGGVTWSEVPWWHSARWSGW